MTRKRPRIGAVPVHVTDWDHFWVEGGVLYASFWSGPQVHVLSMGPCKAHEAIELTKRALARCPVVSILGEQASH